MDYNIIVDVYAGNVNVPAQLCNYIEFINCGEDFVNVEGVRIPPGGSWAPSPPLQDEGDNTQYRLMFSPGDAAPWVAVTRKFYIGKRSD